MLFGWLYVTKNTKKHPFGGPGRSSQNQENLLLPGAEKTTCRSSGLAPGRKTSAALVLLFLFFVCWLFLFQNRRSLVVFLFFLDCFVFLWLLFFRLVLFFFGWLVGLVFLEGCFFFLGGGWRFFDFDCF